MNNVFRGMVNKILVVFIDDILVLSNNEEDHQKH